MSGWNKPARLMLLVILILALIPTGPVANARPGEGERTARTRHFPLPPYRYDDTGPLEVERAAPMQGPPDPLPEDCDDVTPIGGTPPACCIYGYVYHGDDPVAGANVTIESPHGTLNLTTGGGAASNDPYYRADLSSAPLLVSPGDVITITASYGGMVSARTWTVQSDGQHVDIGVVTDYRSPKPVTARTAQAYGPKRGKPAGDAEAGTGRVPNTSSYTNTLRLYGLGDEDAAFPYAADNYDGPLSLTDGQAPPKDFLQFNPAYLYHLDANSLGQFGSYFQSAIKAGGGDASEKVHLRMWYVPRYPVPRGLTYPQATSPVYNQDDNGLGDIVLEYTYILLDPSTGDPVSGSGQSTGLVFPMADSGGQPGLDHMDVNGDGQPEALWVEEIWGVMDGSITAPHVRAGIGNGEKSTRGIIEVVPQSVFGPLYVPAGGEVRFLDYAVKVLGIDWSGQSVDVSIYYLGNETPSLLASIINLNLHEAAAVGRFWLPHVEVFSSAADAEAAAENAMLSTNLPARPWWVELDSLSSIGGTYYATLVPHRLLMTGETFFVDGVEYDVAAIMVEDRDPTSGVTPALKYITLRNPLPKGDGTLAVDYLTLFKTRIPPMTNLWMLPPFNYEHDIIDDTHIPDYRSGPDSLWDDNPGVGLGGAYDTIGERRVADTPALSGTVFIGWMKEEKEERFDTDLTEERWEVVGGDEEWRWLNIETHPWDYTEFVLPEQPDVTDPVDNDDGDYVVVSSLLTEDSVEVWESDPGQAVRMKFVYDAALTASGTGIYVNTPKWWPPIADFTATPVFGTAPLTVTFTDLSTGNINSWSWDFGDGGTSTLRNPTHVYTVPGIYTVILTVSGPGGTDVEVKVNYITVAYPAPVADFTATPLSGTAPLTVTFTDLSTGNINSWSWDFGDGGSSGARHPSHTYRNPGTYTVSLTVTGPGGSDTETKPNYITVNPGGTSPPVASINFIWYSSYPNPAIQGQDVTYFNGSGHDTDENGAYITAYVWNSSIDGVLSTHEDFTLKASALSAGTHIVSFKVKDNEGEWSPEVTRTLTVQASSAGVRTLILVNRQKLEALYGASDAAQVMNKLNALAAHSSVKGLILQVENDPTVAAAYTDWDAHPTDPAKANGVAQAIKGLIDLQWATYPNLEYLVIVGDDRVIPFYRVPDQTSYPESNYCSKVSSGGVTGAAICNNMMLTDDYYADAQPTFPNSKLWNGQALYIPDLGLGRLIETPDEIIAQIDAFLADDTVSISDAIVTGYDLGTDTAHAVCDRLITDTIPTDCTLIGQSWDAGQFKNKVLNDRHEIVSINNHSNHFTIKIPVKPNVSSIEVVSATADHARAVFYTPGCHSGLNVPPTNPVQPLDLPQAFARHKANYIANTGYGVGSSQGIAYSERLMLDLTEQLVYGRSAIVGEALATAKQEYYLNKFNFNDYDEKILIESTLYGLPMYHYTTPKRSRAVPRTLPDRWEVRRQGVTPEGKGKTGAVDDGLMISHLSYQFPPLTLETTDDGQYYTLDGLVHIGHNEPIQPKYFADISLPEMKAHGVVFRGGVYTDITPFDPVIAQAITETMTLPEPEFDAPGWYPPLLHTLNSLEWNDRLVTLLGQFDPRSQTERLYNSLSFDVYYHSTSEDWVPPIITDMSSEWDGEVAYVIVGVGDESGIEAVVVAYTDGDGTWDSVELVEEDGIWFGEFSAAEGAVFFIQAVDKAGNVAVRDNGGRYFKPGDRLHMVYIPLVLRDH